MVISHPLVRLRNINFTRNLGFTKRAKSGQIGTISPCPHQKCQDWNDQNYHFQGQMKNLLRNVWIPDATGVEGTLVNVAPPILWRSSWISAKGRKGRKGREGKGREGKGREEGTSYCITITILTYDNTYKHVFYLILFAHAHIYRYFICTYCIPKEALQPTWNKLQLDPKPTLKKNFEPTLETPWIKPKLKELHSQPQVNLKPTWNKS